MLKGKTILRVTRRGYEPADEDGKAQHAKFQEGDLIAAGISRPRSLPQIRLYWQVLTYVAEASQWETPERLHIALKVRLGLYDLMQLPNGKVVPVVQSASFENMAQDEFQTFMDNAFRVICEEVVPGISSAELIERAQAAIGGRATEKAA